MSEQNISEKATYVSMKALSHAKSIPFQQLKLAKALNADGFNTNNSINWRLFEPWYEVHKAELLEKSSQTWEQVKIENGQKDSLIKDEQLKKLRREALDPADVREFISRVQTKQAAVFKSSIKDLSTKHPHLKGALDRLIQEICAVFQGEATTWMR